MFDRFGSFSCSGSLDYITRNTTGRALLLRFVTENGFVAQIGWKLHVAGASQNNMENNNNQ